MTWRAPRELGPEPLPPAELLRIRDDLATPPRPQVRQQHLAAAAAEARHGRSTAAQTAQALARRGARVIAGVAGIVVVTSGLAGAQIIPEPARALTAAVTERLVPGDPEPTPEEVPVTGDVADATTTTGAPATTDAPPRSTDQPGPVAAAVPAPTSTSTSTTSTSVAETTTSTTSSTTTSTTEPGSSTTTTVPGSSTTTTTVPGSSTTTTEPQGKTGPPPAPAFGRQDPDPDPGGSD